MTGRIAPIDPPYAPEIQQAFDVAMRGAPPLLLFRTVARNPRVLQRMMAGGLLDRLAPLHDWAERWAKRTR